MIDLLTAANAPTILEAALLYSKAGLTVLPVTLKKFPEGIKGHENITQNSEAQIRGWYQNPRYVGVAIRPGTASQNIVMIDCDGMAVYEAFCNAFPQLTETYTERSGSGQGMHLFFQVDRLPDSQHAPELKSGKVARKGIFNTSELGFEIFFDKGQVVVAPSQHKSGNHYTVEKAAPVMHIPDIDAVVCWALALETEADKERKARYNTLRTGGQVGQGEIPTDVIGEIERALGITRYNANGWSKPIACILKNHEHDAESPGSAWHKDMHIFKCFKCGQVLLAKETAAQLGIGWPEKRQRRQDAATVGQDAKPARVIHPASLPAFTADFTVSVPYVTAFEPDSFAGRKTLAIKSATGTGKTEFVARLIQSLPESATVLAITHRVSLVENNARRLATLHYKDEYSTSAQRIASTVDSLHKQAGRRFDVLFIDEAAQVLRHLASAGTTKERTIPLYETFKQLVRDAGTVILADANLNNAVLAFFRALRPDVYAINNSYQPRRAGTVLLDNHKAAIQEAVNRVGEGQGIVLVPCATQRDARLIHKLLKKYYPGKSGRIITARNSETTETKHFVASINQHISGLDWLVYTSSMGTGVDIQAPVYAVVGIFGQPVTPGDAMQMLARARHATHRAAYAPDCVGAGESDPDRLLSYALTAAAETSRYGIDAPDASTRGLARLKAIFDAEDNRAAARYVDTLAAYLSADGSAATVEARQVSAAIKADWKAINEAEKDDLKRLTLISAPVSSADLDAIRGRGQEITDEIHAGNLRYKIEDASGMDISPDLYDRLKTAEHRRRLERLASLIDDETALKELDQRDASDRQPLHRRRNWQAAARLFMHILKTAFHVESVEALKSVLVKMPDSELAARVEFIGQMHVAQLKALLNYRESHDAAPDNAIGLFRWVCKRFGMKLERQRARQDGELIYVYTLDAQELDELLTIARHRIAHQRAAREKACSRIVNLRENDEMGTNADDTPPALEKAPMPLILRPPTVRKAGNPNPFAVQGAA